MGRNAWFEYRPGGRFAGSVIDAGEWLEKPAGRRGFVTMERDSLAFEDGTPVKFWGVNICNGAVAVARDKAAQWAEKLAAHGVNCVRFHKFTWHGDREGIGGARVSTELDENLAGRWDWFVNELKQRGIYTGWSHIYGHRLRPGDRERVLAYDEVVGAQGAHLAGSTYGLVNFAPDLQNLAIDLTVGMLARRNPYTGLRYADDPALAYIELQNEDDIFFPATMEAVNRCPTYKREFCRQFSQWLRTRYGSEAGLRASWGARGLNAYPEYQQDESLDKENIYPIAHFWWYSPEGLADQDTRRGTRRRLLDTARFLYETQNAFYGRFATAIRATGYRGCIVGSPWQAGSGISHYYNLHSDALAGVVDRHNYFGGGGGHVLAPGPIDNSAMVSAPGGGLLGTGFQQVAGRPFFLSEWISRLPNEWVAEGPPIVAAYGLGLQGWDGSFEFASNYPDFPTRLDAPNVYNADAPTQMGLYPALTRMLMRRDVAEGAIVAERTVHVDSLLQGSVGFDETITQHGDEKVFAGAVPPEALAVGRVVVRFADTPASAGLADLERYWDRANKVLRSTTGTLKWHYGGRGYFTIDTPGTQAVVGFAQDREIELAGLSIRPATPFAVIFVTSLDRVKPIAEAGSLLVTTVGRTRNTGMRFSDDGSRLEEAGGPPLLVEGIVATITMKGTAGFAVEALDINGFRTGRELRLCGRSFVVDGAAFETIYYEVRRR